MELEKLKAQAYDLIAFREQSSLQLKRVNQEIADFIQKEDEKKKAEEEKEIKAQKEKDEIETIEAEKIEVIPPNGGDKKELNA